MEEYRGQLLDVMCSRHNTNSIAWRYVIMTLLCDYDMFSRIIMWEWGGSAHDERVLATAI